MGPMQTSPVVRRPPKRGKATGRDGSGNGDSPMTLKTQSPQKRMHGHGFRKELFPPQSGMAIARN